MIIYYWGSIPHNANTGSSHMKIKKYLYKYPQNTSWKYVIQVYRTYIASRKNYKEIIEIYRECVECNFDINKMMEIKEKYDEKIFVTLP